VKNYLRSAIAPPYTTTNVTEAPSSRSGRSYRAIFSWLAKLLRPRYLRISLGFILVLTRSGLNLVIPYSTKYLVDNILTKGRASLLFAFATAVIGATVAQAGLSYILTQLLSKEAQRLVTDFREELRTHISALPFCYFDNNSTGTLVSRIMSDVLGLQSLVSSSLLEFLGGISTSSIAFAVLFHENPVLTILITVFLGIFARLTFLSFATLRPVFRQTAKISGEVSGRLTESLNAVRLVKSFHAEHRENAVFSVGARRLLSNVMVSLDITSRFAFLSATLLGFLSALVVIGAGVEVINHTMTIGGYVQYTAVLAFLIISDLIGGRSRDPNYPSHRWLRSGTGFTGRKGRIRRLDSHN
jgi:ABC-type multidrug transport system fused ATPase/permease subunit